MTRNKAARNSGNYSRANVPSMRSDGAIITRDVLTAVAGVALIVGVPFLMALMKQMGVW